MSASSSLPVRRLLYAFAIASVCAISVTISAQIPTRNVNMVSGLVWPQGDPFMQRQNEPSVAASTRNPLHLLGGSNDYRSVDLPMVLSDVDGEVGDAWLGLYKSTDGGERWTSTLLPGYPHDGSLEGLTSPINVYHAAADPVVRAGTNGLIYYAGLAFDRTPAGSAPGKSAIFVSRFIDNNNQEAGDPFEYVATSLVTSNPGGATNVFLDKPWMAVDIPRQGGGTCQITTRNEHGPFTQRVPAGNVYVAYTVKSVDSQGDRWDLYFSRSADCGAHFSAPMRISRTQDRVNQGANILISPSTGAVYIAWRRIDLAADGEEDHAIVVASSTDQGNKWNPPGVARRFPRGKKNGLDPTKFTNKGKKNSVMSTTEVSTDLVPFDQGSSASGLAFRTNAYPSMTADATGRLYLAWTERQQVTGDPTRPLLTDGDARILLSNSADGVNWSAPQIVHDVGQLGHQIMPALSFAGGKLMVAYYDLQEDRSAVFTKHVDDATAFARTSPDRRHTIDIRVSMGTPGPTPVFEPSRSVSSYMTGARGSSGTPEQLQVNPPNLPLFKLGTTPFIGDYIDIAPSPAFVPNGTGGWAYNTAPTTTPPVFHVAWTDNRDVKPPLDKDWTKYTPPHYLGERPPHAPGEVVEVCVDGFAGTRNQNVYTARVTGGLIVGSPQNSKVLNTQFSRAFVVFARNTTTTLAPRVFRMTILNQPPGGRASFSQFPSPPFTPASEPPLTTIDLTVPRLSSASRTVYVTSSDPHAPVTVDVSEISAVGGTDLPLGLEGRIYLNLDVSNPEVDNPEVDNVDPDNPEVDNAEVYNPEVDNPEVDNPEVDNPEVDNPEVDNPEVDNPEVDNIVVGNPEVDNPEVDNPEVDNPEVDNPEVDNPEVDNGAILEGGGIVTDITWRIRNVGNTTTAYNVNLFLRRHSLPSTGTAQLLIYKMYKTPIIKQASCDVKTTTQKVMLVNIPSPTLVLADGTPSEPNDTDENHATLWLEPGGEVFVDLRVSDPDITNNIIVDGNSIDPDWVPDQDVYLILQPQPVDTPDIPPGTTVPIEPEFVGVDPRPILTVTTTADAGAGSLREAMTIANAQAGLDTIHFNIPGAGPHVITPASLLPNQAEPVIIDGSTQPGYAGTPVIEIDGNGLAGGAIKLIGGNSTIRGLALNRFGDAGVKIEGPGGNGIFGNYIGVDLTGAVAKGNGNSGISISTSDSNEIGGIPALDRNVISANSFIGVSVDGVGNSVEGNYIGTNAAGTAALPQISGVAIGSGSMNIVRQNTISGHLQYGVMVGAPANTIEGNYIGLNAAGTASIENIHGITIVDEVNNRIISNVISGNDEIGIIVTRAGALGAAGTQIKGNFIGTDPTGMFAIPNRNGISFAGVTNTVLGGASAAERNIISGNLEEGVYFSNTGVPSTNNVVIGNYIGVDAAGTGDLGNGYSGLVINNSSNNTIGGAMPGTANVISGNGMEGVYLAGTSQLTDNNVVIGNRIGTSADGQAPIPNVFSGVRIHSTAPGTATGNVIGDITAGNVISGNGAGGITVLGAPISNTQIHNNYIGVAADGSTPIANGGAGIAVTDASGTMIGGGLTNIISGNGIGVIVNGAPSTTITSNKIGVNADGTAAVPNAGGGILIQGAGATAWAIGAPGSGNVVSGNGGTGIEVNAVPPGTISSNVIGLSALMNADLGNNAHGIDADAAGATVVDGNIISGNGQDGIHVDASSGIIVTNNKVGVNAAGAAFGNGLAGLRVSFSPNVSIGGAAAANTFSANQIGMMFVSSSGAQIANNFVGTDPTGVAARPNSGDGVRFEGASSGVMASGLIAFNAGMGVRILSPVTGVRLGARIHSNGGLGIDLGDDGVSANDAQDVDGGANGTQNYPVITSAMQSLVTGTLNSTPNTFFNIVVFASTSCDPTGFGEGETNVGQTFVLTNGSGDAVWSVGGLALTPGSVATAIATNLPFPGASSSEFSACVAVVNNGPLNLVVNNTSDSGPGSLRSSLQLVNVNPAFVNNVTFNIPGAGPHTITPASALPMITAPVNLDASTQPGWAGTPIVELDGSSAPGTTGLEFRSNNSKLRGFVINRFDTGVKAISTNGLTVEGNYIGTDVTGTIALGNTAAGMEINGSSNTTIGGTTPDKMNLLSGNGIPAVIGGGGTAGWGVGIINGGTGNVVIGNRVGTNAAGTAALSNHGHGVFVSSDDSRVGGSAPGERNIISGNGTAADVANGSYANGVGLQGTNSRILGNYIGVDVTGTVAITNTGGGVGLSVATGNFIGGPGPGEGNVISGNGAPGVSELFGQGVNFFGASGNTVQGNLIGTDLTGTVGIPNVAGGIFAMFTDNNIIGGDNPGESNVIAFNTGYGVGIQAGAVAGAGNSVLTNSIHSNTGLDIDLIPLGSPLPTGVTPNDVGDADGGANLQQNFPVISSALQIGAQTFISGSLNSTANSNFDIRVFASPACNASGYGGGLSRRQLFSITTDGAGNFNFNTVVTGAPAGWFITATATDAAGNTSEFSQCTVVNTP